MKFDDVTIAAHEQGIRFYEVSTAAGRVTGYRVVRESNRSGYASTDMELVDGRWRVRCDTGILMYASKAKAAQTAVTYLTP